MSKHFNFHNNNIYSNSLKAVPTDSGCLFFIDCIEAKKSYESSKVNMHACVLPAEEAYKEAMVNIAVSSSDMNTVGSNDNVEIGVAVYDIKTGLPVGKYSAQNASYTGSIYSVFIADYKYNEWAYAFYYNEYVYTDIRAGRYIDKPAYGDFVNALPLKAVIDVNQEFEDDNKPQIRYEDAFVYQLHVRGFTKHSSSGTKYKGTFRGVIDKLGYLKELGVTTLEFQPVNEFNECDSKTGRLNYWGYCPGFYYAPKSAYSYSKNTSAEFIDMVRAIHSNDQEIILQMYFANDFSKREIVSILEYWTVKYHIDGFHLLSENAPIDLIDSSSLLKGSKIWCDKLDGANIDNAITGVARDRRYALYRDDYMYSMRRFLKADEYSINDAIGKMRENHEGYANINYFGAFNTFTLTDMVSYERKRNEDNGEDNRDGSDYNCSWNCGEEGSSRKTKVLALRKKQVKNALLMLMLSAGTPMIYMGDELGRTQLGNNNPYCLDNKITWVDWSLAKKQNNRIDFIKTAIGIRKSMDVLHSARELSMVDVCGCGYPELSYHGESAWKSQTEGHRHEFGVMFCDNGKLLYMAINMHWESAVLSMPRPPKGYDWKLILTTSDEKSDEEVSELSVKLSEHTIALYEVCKKVK